MSEIKTALKTTGMVLAVIFVLRQLPITSQLVGVALTGNTNAQ
ncbi:hypothetical protein NUJ30_25510 [Burkholderia contaminans]|nr:MULTISPECIES: hypothetical protein [Burkholderia cepacia complex]UXZ70033.1 hypothetical protein NUJ29_31110 [Burkholderia contaminans]UXZ76740.1 hypothetical protein NUJ30_25510 [Burkholderia contaminans]